MEPLMTAQQEKTAGGSVATAVLRALLFGVIFVACVKVGTLLLGSSVTVGQGDMRARVAFLIVGSLVGQLLAAGLLLFWVFRTGRDFTWLGLKGKAPSKAWMLAVVIAAGWAFLVWNGVLAGSSGFWEVSLWRLGLALAAGVIGGTCEELVFRGAVIQSLADARCSRWVQVAAGSLLFGLAHLGWAAFSGNVVAGIAAAVFTSILGAALTFLFLWSGRRLWPCIAAHALINLLIEPWLVFAVLQGRG